MPTFSGRAGKETDSNSTGPVIVRGHPAIKIRGYKSNPIPYWELPLAANGEKLIVRELIVSPSIDTKLLIETAKKLTQVFRDRVELDEGQIKESAISYLELWKTNLEKGD